MTIGLYLRINEKHRENGVERSMLRRDIVNGKRKKNKKLVVTVALSRLPTIAFKVDVAFRVCKYP